MGFPESVAEKALLDCGRHCCICHKFCGFKIELHHIVQKSQEGAHTYENCIPLCFDCHAEVKFYDPKHAKGRKYTDSELKKHRDKWYEKVINGSLVVVHPECIELDRKLFLKIREILPGTGGSIAFIRVYSYGIPFLREKHEGLWEYRRECERSDFEFIDVDLESRKSQLTDTVIKFLDILNAVVSPGKYWHENSKYEVYPDIKYSNSRLYLEAINNVENAANDVCSAYDDLVRLGRRKLAIE